MDEPKLSLVEKRQRALDKRSKLIKELEIDVCRLESEDYSNIEDQNHKADKSQISRKKKAKNRE